MRKETTNDAFNDKLKNMACVAYHLNGLGTNDSESNEMEDS